MSEKLVFSVDSSKVERSFSRMLNKGELKRLRKKALDEAGTRLRGVVRAGLKGTYGRAFNLVKYINKGIRRDATATWVTTAQGALLFKGTVRRSTSKGYNRGAMRQTDYVNKAITPAFKAVVDKIEKRLALGITAKF